LLPCLGVLTYRQSCGNERCGMAGRVYVVGVGMTKFEKPPP